MKLLMEGQFEVFDLWLQRVLTLVMVVIDMTRETPPKQKVTSGPKSSYDKMKTKEGEKKERQRKGRNREGLT